MFTIPYSVVRVVNYLTSFVALMCLLASGTARAEESHVVYVPLVFHAEARDLLTSGCLQLKEHSYGQGRWWELPEATGGSAQAFKEVIAAIQKKDRESLLKWTDPKQAADTKSFNDQADAFFQQFGRLELVSVPKAYEFDGLAVFFSKFRSSQGLFFAPFIFTREGNGMFGFLPQRTRQVTYEVLNDWFQSAWGPGKSQKAVYCKDADIKGATHRIPVAASGGSDQSFLLLKGAPIDTRGPLADLAARVKSTIEQMTAALSGRNMPRFVKYLTPEGGGRLQEWFASASSEEQKQYESAVVGQRPFYVFDLSSVVVAYTKASTGPAEVMYFTFSSNHELLWTNSSHVTVADRIFKSGPLRQSSQLSKPFSNILIR